MIKILVCDDDRDIAAAVKIYLSAEGYDVVTAYNGNEAIAALKDDPDISLCLLDIMMPGKDGIETLIEMRGFCNTPVIFLTAKGEDTDKSLGLNLGADDYVTKPFNPSELTARVRSQVRRYTTLGARASEPDVYTNGGLTVDDRSKRVTADGAEISLTKTEYQILLLFMKNRNKTFSPAEIYAAVWNMPSAGAENTVAVHIRHLREKIEINPAEPRYIKVLWGYGYIME